MLVGGGFSSVNGTSRTSIARLNANGTLDSSFVPDLVYSYYPPLIKSLVVQSSGKVLIGGYFSTVNGSDLNGIARLNTNGSLDGSFNLGQGVSGGEYPAVNSVVFQADGNLIIGGDFTTVNGVLRPYVARLYGDLSTPPSFTAWAAGFGLVGAGAAADADPDDDGLRNGLEWILGGDPTMPTYASRPTASLIAGNMIFTFPRTDLSETPDMTLRVETSTDLVSWPTLFTVGATTAASSPGVTILENGAAADTITVTIAPGTATRLFARLRITITP